LAAVRARCDSLVLVRESLGGQPLNTSFTRWSEPAWVLYLEAAKVQPTLRAAEIPIRNPIRILIADDHTVVRYGLRTILEAHEGWQVCGEAKSGAEALALAVQLRPEIIILDLNMPGMNGFDALKAIRQRVPETGVVVLTLHFSNQLVREIIRAGARAYVMKSDADRDLVEAVSAVAAGKSYLTAVAEAAHTQYSSSAGDVSSWPSVPVRSSGPGPLPGHPVGPLSAGEREAVRNIAQTIRKLI
jgi:DNA-binding NarL/FixJ family response regulator